MNDVFKSHNNITEEDFTKLWEKGLFVFDTNVLLDLYRLPESAKKDLLNILNDNKINNRVWLPFQVVLEFTHNKLEAISDQKNKFNTVRTIINDSIDETKIVYDNLFEKLNKLQLKKRHSAINPDEYIDDNLFKESLNKLNKFLKELDKLDAKQPDVNNKDSLKDEISKIFKNKIGASFTKDELETIFTEGILRYKDNIPPGYKDRDKEGFYLFEDKKIIRKFGDLLVWKEIINKAEKENLEFIILVTGDSKEDWWQEKRGKKLGPRYELLNEIYFKAPNLKIFHMYDTSGFMQYAKQYLKINVKDQSIKESKDLIEYNKLNEQITTSENGIISIRESIRQISKQISIKIILTKGFEDSPFIFIPNQLFQFVLMEILSNVFNHSFDKIVTISLDYDENYLILKFKNKTNNFKTESNKFRGKGIEFISSVFNGEYGYISTELDDKFYQIQLFIDKKFTSTPKRVVM